MEVDGALPSRGGRSCRWNFFLYQMNDQNNGRKGRAKLVGIATQMVSSSMTQGAD